MYGLWQIPDSYLWDESTLNVRPSSSVPFICFSGLFTCSIKISYNSQCFCFVVLFHGPWLTITLFSWLNLSHQSFQGGSSLKSSFKVLILLGPYTTRLPFLIFPALRSCLDCTNFLSFFRVYIYISISHHASLLSPFVTGVIDLGMSSTIVQP